MNAILFRAKIYNLKCTKMFVLALKKYYLMKLIWYIENFKKLY